jgi:hypothetical protein
MRRRIHRHLRQGLFDRRLIERVEDASQDADPSRVRIPVVGDEAPQLGHQGALLVRVKFKAHQAAVVVVQADSGDVITLIDEPKTRSDRAAHR